MVRKDGLSEIDRYAIRSIECRVRGLIGHYGITPDECEDLVQQLFLEYLQRIRSLDPARGRYRTFVNCVVRNQVASLVRARRHRSRLAILCPLPCVQAEDADDETPAENDLSEDAVRMTLGRASRPATELLDLRLDVDRARESLSPELRAIGDRVVAAGVSDVSKAMGCTPSRVYQLLWQMRPAFAELGLGPAAAGGVR